MYLAAFSKEIIMRKNDCIRDSMHTMSAHHSTETTDPSRSVTLSIHVHAIPTNYMYVTFETLLENP